MITLYICDNTEFDLLREGHVITRALSTLAAYCRLKTHTFRFVLILVTTPKTHRLEYAEENEYV